MPCDTMRPITGSSFRTSPSSPTSPFLPNETAHITMQAEQKAEDKGWADLTTTTAVTSTASSIHTNILSTYTSAKVWLLPPPRQMPSQGTNILCLLWSQSLHGSVNSARKHSIHPTTSEAPEEAGHPGSANPSATHTPSQPVPKQALVLPHHFPQPLTSSVWLILSPTPPSGYSRESLEIIPAAPTGSIENYQTKASPQGEVIKASTAMVWDTVALKQAFPNSFNTIGIMSRTPPLGPSFLLPLSSTPSRRYLQILETDRAHPQWHGQQGGDSTCLPANQMGIFPHLSTQAWWYLACLDPKDLNRAIVLEHYIAPTLDEISHQLSGATCFSKVNAKDSFWSIHLDEKSSYLTTFNMHHGRYRLLHMPFSLKMSQDVFQMQMDQTTDCL